MSHSHPAGLLAAYNSLTDKHLAGYFNNTRIRRHLLRSGLITRSGRILSEKEYKLNIMKRDHQKYIRECLAQAIFHKVLDMERYHQLEIKKKLETLARKERVQRFKDPTKQSIENNMPILSPRPPVGQKSNLGQSVLIDELHSSPLTRTAPRPYTAPGNMQPPIRLQPLSSNPSIGTVPKITTRPRSKTSMLENETPFPIGGKKAVMKFRSSMENSWGTNLYQLPNINNYMMPIPPPPPLPDGKFTRENRAETWRRRRFRPITASNGLEPLFTKDSRRIHKTSLHSNAAITMIYFGKNVHLSYDDSDFRDEIKVYQQHCGGENLCVYKGKLLEKETFQFISKRHHGFPFSLTFFLNGIQVNRLSSCCEYKHRKGSRLGGKRGYFGFVCVERSSPCYKCIIAMGLDKKTSSSKTRKENAEKREELKKSKGKLRKDEKYMIPRRNEIERNRTLVSAIFSAQEEEMGVKEVRTAMEEMERKGKPGQDIWEDDQENTFKYEYEEDFEVDEEKQDEKTNEEGQADDQMNGMSKSPSDDEKDNLDPEKESETSSQKAPDADDNVKDESDGRSVTELEEDKQDRKTASSISSRSHRNSSCSEEESSVEDRDAHTENSSEESARSPSSRELSENDESGKPHLPVEESLETETLDQEIIKAEVETKPVPAEENYDNALKEEMEEGAQVTTEGLSVKSRDHISKEEKEKTKRKLWEGSTTNAKDEKAGSPGVKKGGVRQVIAESLDPGCHSYSEAEPGVSSSDEQEEHLKRLEIDTHGAPNENLVVEERTLLNLNKEPKQVAPEMYTLEKKAAIEENEVPQPRDADRTEQKGEATLWGKIGVNEVPLGEWKVTGVQPALAEQFTMEREVPQDIESGTRVAAEGDRNVGREGLNSTEKEGVGDSANLNEGEAPEEQGLVQTVLEIEKAVSEGEQGSEDSALRSKAAALREAAMPPEKGDTTGAAVSEAGSEKPDEEENKEEASTDLENTSPVEEAASKRKDASEKALLGGEEPAKEWEEVMGIETPLSSSVSEKEGVNQMNWEDSFKEERKECKKDMEREKVVTEAESYREDDRKEMLSEELDAAGERKKAERLKTHLRDTESEKEDVKRANALKHEYASEEGKKEEKETVKENRPDGKTKAPTKEMDSESADKVPMEESEVAEDAGLQRKDSLKARGVVMCEAVLGPEKSLENITALRKGGEERLTETRDTEHKFRVQLLPEENVAPSEKDEGPQYDGESVLGTPESELAGKAQGPEVIVTTGEDEECAAEDQDRLAGPEGRDTEGPLQGRKGIGDLTMTQGDVPEEDSMIAEKFNEEAMGEDMEEGEEKCSLGRGIMKNRSSEGERSLTEEAIAEEDLNQGETTEMTMEKREELADAKRSEEKIANIDSSFADIAGEETWHKVDELVGKTAAAERVVVEGIALSQEKVQAVEEVTVTSIAEVGLGAVQKPSNLEGGCPQLGYDQQGGEEETTPQVGLLGEEEEGMGSSDKEQEPGAAEAFRQRLPWETEVELKRESPQAVETLPIKPDFTETQEKPKHMVQRESENADVSGNHVEA